MVLCASGDGGLSCAWLCSRSGMAGGGGWLRSRVLLMLRPSLAALLSHRQVQRLVSILWVPTEAIRELGQHTVATIIGRNASLFKCSVVGVLILAQIFQAVKRISYTGKSPP